MKKEYVISAGIALLVSIISVYSLNNLHWGGKQSIKIEHVNNTPAQSTLYGINANGNFEPLDFTQTAEKVVNAVVNIQSSVVANNAYGQNYNQLPDQFRQYFGEEFYKHFYGNPDNDNNNQKQNPNITLGTGSGVIINQNGYIVTNNHVVANADDIEVTLHDNRTYKATVVGTDPNTDLAVIQIKESNLPYLAFENSDNVRVGEWVLAVGNPFSLNSTVTAGIVSAKGRNINILREQYAVESFIQTDAAINPGNSGGALVNINGGLIGVNTAIASPTGSYSGYGFAIPSNIVSKVVDDLIKFGIVQRGVLGVVIRSVDGNLAEEKNLEINEGVYVENFSENSAAENAGVKTGDVIVAVDGAKVATSPQLQELIARKRPGDIVKITVIRNGKEKEIDVTLNNRNGNTKVVAKEEMGVSEVLGCEVTEVNPKIAQNLGIDGGVKITKLRQGKLSKYTQVREGFIITHIDNKKVTSVSEFNKIMETKKGGIMIEGVYENVAGKFYYAFGM